MVVSWITAGFDRVALVTAPARTAAGGHIRVCCVVTLMVPEEEADARRVGSTSSKRAMSAFILIDYSQWRHRSAGGPLTDLGLGALTFGPHP